ncbi:MAG: AraC family transcriptional regulator ligand-binding domain-containing protein [Aliishimia sp.]
MSLSAKYHIADGVRFFAHHFGIDPKPAIARAGLPMDFLDGTERLVTGPQYYDLWESMTGELSIPDLPKALVAAVLKMELDSAVYSFFSSPTIGVGLQRKALFKPLIMPVHIDIRDDKDTLSVSFTSPLVDRPFPVLLGWFDLTFLVAIARKASATNIIPRRIEMAQLWPSWSDAEEYFGCEIVQSDAYRLVLNQEDADRPLVSRNDSGWAEIVKDLPNKFAGNMITGSIAARARQALLEGLPGGQAGADQIARMLGLSKRSLQRRLAEEDMQFKEILEDTRRALALSYLQRRDIGMQEIALLLGFRDPSSFFRAFKGWTGQTPRSLRGER